MTETEDALRQRIADLEAQLAATRFVPELPAEHEGEAITWRLWEAAPVILCTRAGDLNSCPSCDHPGPSLIAFGLAGPGTPKIRFNAHRCPGCQEMRVYKRVYDKLRVGADMREIAYSAPRTIPKGPGDA